MSSKSSNSIHLDMCAPSVGLLLPQVSSISLVLRVLPIESYQITHYLEAFVLVEKLVPAIHHLFLLSLDDLDLDIFLVDQFFHLLLLLLKQGAFRLLFRNIELHSRIAQLARIFATLLSLVPFID